VRLDAVIYIRLYIICCLNRLKEEVILYTMKGVIYLIKTADGLYVGSTFDFKRRKREHYDNIKKRPNQFVYKNIISNNGIYKIEIYCNVNCRDRRHLNFFEEQYRIILGANLNSQKCFANDNDYREYHKRGNKKYYVKNKDKINIKANEKFSCECGGKYTLRNRARHLKLQIHLNYIKDSQAPPL
jgi:hypothetical protein